VQVCSGCATVATPDVAGTIRMASGTFSNTLVDGICSTPERNGCQRIHLPISLKSKSPSNPKTKAVAVIRDSASRVHIYEVTCFDIPLCEFTKVYFVETDGGSRCQMGRTSMLTTHTKFPRCDVESE
jgi:hypothetical protein